MSAVQLVVAGLASVALAALNVRRIMCLYRERRPVGTTSDRWAEWSTMPVRARIRAVQGSIQAYGFNAMFVALGTVFAVACVIDLALLVLGRYP